MKTQTSKYKGVFFDTERGWSARITVNGRKVVRRGFSTEIEAVEARKLLSEDPTLTIEALRELISQALEARGIDPTQEPNRWLNKTERNIAAGEGYGSGDRPRPEGWMSLRDAKKANLAR